MNLRSRIEALERQHEPIPPPIPVIILQPDETEVDARQRCNVPADADAVFIYERVPDDTE